MLTQSTSVPCNITTIDAARPINAVQPVYAQPNVPYLTQARARANPYINPHDEFIPTTQEHLRAMCEQHDYTTVHNAITPAHLRDLNPIDLRRIFWLVELQGDLRELCQVDRTLTLSELHDWATTPHIAVMLQTLRLHPDCYLPAQPVGRTSGAAACQATSTLPFPPNCPVPTHQSSPSRTQPLAAHVTTNTTSSPAPRLRPHALFARLAALLTVATFPYQLVAAHGQVEKVGQQSPSPASSLSGGRASVFAGGVCHPSRFIMAHPGKSTDPNVFILPDLGEGVHEAELIKWRVKVGDAVKEHDILADMETDKAVVEVPSPRDGTIAELHGTEGEILHVGNALVTYVGGAASKAASNGKHDKPEAKASAQPPRNVMEHIPEPEERTEDAGTVVGQMSADTPGLNAAPGKALATPAVRRLAKDLGVDIDTIAGTGIGGRVLEKDVRAAGGPPLRGGSNPAAKQPPAAAKPAAFVEPARTAPASKPAAPAAPAARPATPSGDEVTRVPFRGVRRTIANRLRESVNQAVHFTVMDEADVTALDSMRRKLAAASGEKVSFLPFVASAVARVLGQSQFRALNATVDEKPSDPNYEASINQHRSVHLGIAADTDSGLMVPVIRDADRLGVLELSRAIGTVADAARNRTASREQLMGSTFTISNVGSHAGRFATPIINYPEVAILAVGRGREGMVVNKGSFRVGLLLPLSLACDHRVVDGATAALALAEVIKLLQDPDSLLTPARG
ncbi:MAG: dihydrolipoamide acetyltransferase family protein [Phycisphaerae bacterium]